MSCRQLRGGFPGYCAAVFDGCNGWQLSNYCSKNLHKYLEEHLKGAKTEKQIVQALNKTFDQIESEWEELVKVAFHAGYPQTAYQGSTALVALVHENKVYVANSGHSKAVLLREVRAKAGQSN